MPELPEVETIVRTLRPELVGRNVLSVELLWARTLSTPSQVLFEQWIIGQTIVDVSRRAKYINLQLFDKLRAPLSTFNLLIHLRMSGDLYIRAGDASPEKHDRLRLGLSDGRQLVFNDPRKFGRVWLVADVNEVTGRLGPEPFDPAFTAQVLYNHLRQTHRQIKPLLLDQHFLAGLGNIYTDEALHLSGVHPMRLSDTISAMEAEKLFHAIQTVLQAGIDHNGASFDWVYRGGNFQNYFHVYGRAGEPCLVCATPIQRMVVAQRGTHFCPTCQVM